MTVLDHASEGEAVLALDRATPLTYWREWTAENAGLGADMAGAGRRLLMASQIAA